MRARPTDPLSVSALGAVLSVMSRTEWGLIVGLQLLYELASARPMFIANRAAGVPLSPWHVLVVSVVDGVTWLALVPIMFEAFDRTTLRRGQIVLNVVRRVVVAVGIMAAQAAMFCGILAAAGESTDLGGVVRRSPLLGFQYEFETNVTPLLLLSLVYAVLLRVHAMRRQHKAALALQASLSEARLHALLVEMQPHFLFNTLNGIAALVRDDPHTAEAMLIQLSDLLRLTVGLGQPAEISLADELERLDLYLGIQQMRFGPRLSIRQDIAPEALSAAVPTLLLQPVVENALTHGVGQRRGPAILEITCARRDTWLMLSVSDDGVGFPPNTVLRERVGIGNTRARLAAMFGDYWRLDLSNRPAGGATVTITVPYRLAVAGRPAEPSAPTGELPHAPVLGLSPQPA
jgi:two-component system, LytTR family, sensor kinase